MGQEMMGFWDGVAPAGPHANNLHLAPDRQPHQHLSHHSVFTGRVLFLTPNSVKAALYTDHVVSQPAMATATTQCRAFSGPGEASGVCVSSVARVLVVSVHSWLMMSRSRPAQQFVLQTKASCTSALHKCSADVSIMFSVIVSTATRAIFNSNLHTEMHSTLQQTECW